MLEPLTLIRALWWLMQGVLLYGPPGTGKTLSARAVANRTDATFIRVIGSELVQKCVPACAVPSLCDARLSRLPPAVFPSVSLRRYIGEGARMVRELFQMARQRKACIMFFDEVRGSAAMSVVPVLCGTHDADVALQIDAIGGTRFEDQGGGGSDVQRTMLEIVNQLDGFDARGNVKVLMATNRPDTLDPALMRPGRLDRKVRCSAAACGRIPCSAALVPTASVLVVTQVEFGLPKLEGRTHIFKIHAKTMNCDSDIRCVLRHARDQHVSTCLWPHAYARLCNIVRCSTGLSCWPGCARPQRALRSARCARKPACTPSAHGGRASPRRTSSRR